MTKRNVHAARTPNASAKKASAAIATAMSKRIMSDEISTATNAETAV